MTAEAPPEFGNLDANRTFLELTAVLGPGTRALELGTGRGGMIAWLRAQRFHVVGVDVNESLIRESRQRHGPLPLARVGGTALPIRDGAVDVVLSFDVFEHIPDSDAHLREVRRVLAAGGTLLLQTPNKWTNVVFETIRWRSPTKFRQDHCSLHSYRELRARLEAHGFEVRFCDVAAVTPFFRAKVRQYLGWVGTALLAVANPDRWPRPFRTNFYVVARKIDRS